MADVCEDHPTIIAELKKLWPLIKATPWLDWLLLTKRSDRIALSLPDDWGQGYPNVWWGVSCENQEYANLRIPWLLRVPAIVRFVSYEPALGPIDFTRIHLQVEDDDIWLDVLSGHSWREDDETARGDYCHGRVIDWLIYGGESGAHFRPEDKQWARNAMAQCHVRGRAFFHKQSAAPRTEMGIELDGVIVREYPTVHWNILGEPFTNSDLESAGQDWA
jgi:protein gp37